MGDSAENRSNSGGKIEKNPCFFPVKQGNRAETGSLETACTARFFSANRGAFSRFNREGGREPAQPSAAGELRELF